MRIEIKNAKCIKMYNAKLTAQLVARHSVPRINSDQSPNN